MKAHSVELSPRWQSKASTELIHEGHAWHCKAASVCSSTYFQHIYQLLLYTTLYSVLAFCMDSISNSAVQSLRVSQLTLLWINVTPTHPPPPWSQRFRANLESMIFHLLMNMQVVLSARPLPNPPPFFFSSGFPHQCFSLCAVGDRGQPHPSTEWHSMRRRKGVEKSCLVLPLMSKSMHLSLKRRGE